MAKHRVKKFVSRALLFGLMLFLFCCHFRERDTYACSECHSLKHRFQWRLGSWVGISMPLSPDWNELKETRFMSDFLPLSHQHTWKYKQGSPYYFFGTTWRGCALGSAERTNNLFDWYEHDHEMRTYVDGLIQCEEYSKEEMIEILTCPSQLDSTLSQKAEMIVSQFLDS